MGPVVSYLADPVPRDPAQREAAEELSKQLYQQERPSVIAEGLDRLIAWIDGLFESAAQLSPGGGVGLVVIVLLVVAVVVAVIVRFGPLARTAGRAGEADELAPTVSGQTHRERADAFAAEGRYAEAVRERLRAVVAGLVHRELIEDRPGRTAAEVADQAGRALPSVAVDLVEAVTLFGELWYGGRTATAEHDARLREIDARVAAARPSDPATGTGARAGWVAPGATDTR